MAESKQLTAEERKNHIAELKKQLEQHLGHPAFLDMDGLKNLEDQEKFLERILFIPDLTELVTTL